MLLSIYSKLLRYYGHQNWWPVRHSFKPGELEICIGAILTQNTNWRNVEAALENLAKAKKLSAQDIASSSLPALEKLIKPSGFFRQKARRLKAFCRYVANYDGNFYRDITREQLLVINGIGKETADSILLYACSKPFFVVDAYTKRVFSRLGFIDEEGYEEIRSLFEDSLPRNAGLYKEFHALIVEHAKRTCKKEPLCAQCPLQKECKYSRNAKHSGILGEAKLLRDYKSTRGQV